MLLLLDLLDDDDDLFLALSGGVEEPVIPATGQFWAAGFWSAGFWADGFWGEVQPPAMASLGAWGGARRRKVLDDELEEALPGETVSRIRDEMLAASFTADAIKQAKRRRNEAILLLMM